MKRFCTAFVTLAVLSAGGHPLFAESACAWGGELSAGFDMTGGNSDTVALNTGLKAGARVNDNEALLDLRFNYGKADHEKNVENGKALAEYNYHFNPRSYANVRAEYSYDAIADIDYRVIVGPPSLGYLFVTNRRTRVAAEIGAAYLWEEVGGMFDDKPLFRFKESIRQQLNRAVTLFQSLEYLPEASQWRDYLLQAEAGLDSALTERMSFRFSVQDKYDSRPAAEKKPNDLFVSAALVQKL